MNRNGILALAIITLILLVGLMVVVSDGIRNPSEDECKLLSQSNMFWQTFYVEQSMCIKNETGFHANGKGIFR